MQKLKKIFYRWLAKNRLVRRYGYVNEVNRILEEYITKKIIAGGPEEFLAKSRKELIDKQNEIKETDNLVEFLRNLK